MNRLGRSVAIGLTTLLVWGSMAIGSLAETEPGVEIHPEVAGDTGVRYESAIIVSGELPSGKRISAGRVVAYAGGEEIGSEPLWGLNQEPTPNPADEDHYVRNDGGDLSGRVQLGCLFGDATSAPADRVDPACEGQDHTADAAVVELTVDGTTYASNPLTVDPFHPYIRRYRVAAPNRIEVVFSEPVRHPSGGDAASDWSLPDANVVVTEVEGPRAADCDEPTGPLPEDTGCTRTLVVQPALDRDATPRVRYTPGATGLASQDERKYVDLASNDLLMNTREGLGTRFDSTAIDGVPPVVPTIESVAGRTVDGDEDRSVLGNEPTPEVRITDIEPGHLAQVFLDDGDGSFDPEDQLVGQAEAGPDGATTTLGVVLEQGTHRLFARARDNADCEPGTGAGDCPNFSDADRADYDLDLVAPRVDPPAKGGAESIVVAFDEEVVGTDDPADWTVLGPDGEPGPEVTGVSGAGRSRTLDVSGVLPGSSLEYDLQADGYRDEHGNLLADDFPIPIDITLPTVTVEPVTVVETDGPELARFPVRLSEPAEDTVQVSLSTRDGSAVAGDDYRSSSGTVTFLEGQTDAEFAVVVRGDETDEFTEQFELVATAVSGPATLPGSADEHAAAGAIEDDDPVSALEPENVAIEEGASGAVEIRLDRISGKDISLSYELVERTAAFGEDIEPAAGEATIPAGQLAVEVPIETIDDELDEHDELAEFVVGDVRNGDGDATVANVLVADDDPLVDLSATGAEVQEGEEGVRTVQVTVSLDRVSGKTVLVDWQTDDRTAEAGTDYEAASGKLEFQPGETSRHLTVSVLGDAVHEDDETFAVVLDVTNANALDEEALVTILDDDPAPEPEPSDDPDGLPGLPPGPDLPPDLPPVPGEEPSDDPSDDPSDEPSDEPGEEPSDDPLTLPDAPSVPGEEPSDDPSDEPSDDPSEEPSDDPSDDPSEEPSDGDGDDGSPPPLDAQGLVDEAVDTLSGLLPDEQDPDPDGGDGDGSSDGGADSGGSGRTGGGGDVPLAAPDPDADRGDLPRTGGGIAGLGLLALLGAGVLRRRS